MKKKITKSEYYQIMGLMILAQNAYKQVRECERAYGKIIN
jgi:hypothetical protein